MTAPHVYDPNRQIIAQRKTVSVAVARTLPKAPPVYRTNPTQMHALQRHPMLISVEGRQSASTDTGEFLAEWEITGRIPSASRDATVTAIHVRKERRGDHQYLIATTSNGYNLKMHLGANGAVIEAGPSIQATYGEPVDEYTPKRGLTLLQAVSAFYNLAHLKPFSSDDYNCRRFVAELGGKLGTWKRPAGGSDFDAFL